MTPAPDRLSARPRLYLAAPLFSQAERVFNLEVREALEPSFQVYLPQVDGLLLVDEVARGMNIKQAYEAIFAADTTAILAADCLLAVLDGRSIDEGTAFELGFAFAHKKLCFGLQTDPRRLVVYGNNPMIEQAVETVFCSIDELTTWARGFHRLHARDEEKVDKSN
jgi:nucleoside 2-deoxyribosyltransferase